MCVSLVRKGLIDLMKLLPSRRLELSILRDITHTLYFHYILIFCAFCQNEITYLNVENGFDKFHIISVNDVTILRKYQSKCGQMRN